MLLYHRWKKLCGCNLTIWLCFSIAISQLLENTLKMPSQRNVKKIKLLFKGEVIYENHIFDALAFINNLINKAMVHILLIDPYHV